jgi:hypothetical protein
MALVSNCRFSIDTTPLASSITALSAGKAQKITLLPDDKLTAEPLFELASTVVLAIVLPLLDVCSQPHFKCRVVAVYNRVVSRVTV